MKIIFYIIKGRNLKNNILFLKSKNINIEKRGGERILYKKSNKKNFYFFLLKNKNFKNYFKKNIFDIFIVGEDIILNQKKINFFFNYKFIKINLFFISIISNRNYKFKKKIKISSKYKNITEKYLKNKNILKKINYTDGSNEIDCILKNDIILDIVSSSKTIKENNIFEVKKIISFKNILLFNNNIIYNKIFNFMEIICL